MHCLGKILSFSKRNGEQIFVNLGGSCARFCKFLREIFTPIFCFRPCNAREIFVCFFGVSSAVFRPVLRALLQGVQAKFLTNFTRF